MSCDVIGHRVTFCRCCVGLAVEANLLASICVTKDTVEGVHSVLTHDGVDRSDGSDGASILLFPLGTPQPCSLPEAISPN